MSLWLWLGNPDNQKTLAFIGAGIAGLVALLVTLGVVGKKKPEKTSGPALRQHAEVRNGGSAVNVSGKHNAVDTRRGS